MFSARLTTPSLNDATVSNDAEEDPMLTLNINGKQQSVDVDPETPLLWVLRDTLGLTGTK